MIYSAVITTTIVVHFSSPPGSTVDEKAQKAIRTLQNALPPQFEVIEPHVDAMELVEEEVTE